MIPHHFRTYLVTSLKSRVVERYLFGSGHSKSESREGFTLVEMLVVVAVIIVVTSTVIANNNKFGGTILLQNLAYDIALSVRESQVFGVSVLRFGGSFDAPYGVHFELPGGEPSYTYTVFADINESNAYDPGELVSSTNITGGFSISQLCVTPPVGSEDCSPTQLDIVYQHPEPDAYIYANGQPTQYRSARITVRSPRNDVLNIHVELNGQISVHN